MYPLLLKAPIKDYLWGGTKLKTDFGFETEKDIAAEAWVLSCHKYGMNIVLNGEHKGKTLSEVLEIWGKTALGKRAEKFSYFPLPCPDRYIPPSPLGEGYIQYLYPHQAYARILFCFLRHYQNPFFIPSYLARAFRANLIFSSVESDLSQAASAAIASPLV